MRNIALRGSYLKPELFGMVNTSAAEKRIADQAKTNARARASSGVSSNSF